MTDMLFGKYRKNVNTETLLQFMCFQSQVLEFFTSDEPLRRYTLYIINREKVAAMLPRWHDSEWGMSFQSRGKR
jgi:hypothetical protein